jgi:uncharacterized membrane protein
MMDHPDRRENDVLAHELNQHVTQCSRKSQTMTNFLIANIGVFITGALALGALFLQVSTNTEEIAIRRPIVESVPLVQKDVEYIKKAITDARHSQERIYTELRSMRGD